MTELLVVIAITGILLGLLFVPIIQGFNLTRKAQNQIQAQSQARTGIQRMSHEIAQAASVLDNTNAALNFPLKFAVNIMANSAATPLQTWANGVQVRPARVLYTRLDLIPAGKLPSTGTKDPTTGDQIGGSQVRFPLAHGTRMVRYFIGLKDNTKPYQNIYQSRVRGATKDALDNDTEFPFAQDNGLNPFVLYRAEYEPSDPKLFNLANLNSAVSDGGGFNDPNFFYNHNLASNGATYAANWKAISSAVVDGPNQDAITWVKDEVGDLLLTTPFRPLISFAPSSISGDTATPGFLNATAAEVPNAVPTLYSAQQAHWSLPCTVTVYRAVSRQGSEDYGALRVSIDAELQLDGTTRPHVHLDSGATGGVLATDDTTLYCARLASTGEIFIKTPNLTFSLDTERGTVKTGFPPLAGNASGAPLIRLADGTIQPMVAGPWPDANMGELVQTVYRINTRDLAAGAGGVATNQGWGELDLWDNLDPASPPVGMRYFLKDSVDPRSTNYFRVPLLTSDTGNYPSPLIAFGNVGAGGVLNMGGGLMIAAGTEQVQGPELFVTPATAMDASATMAGTPNAGVGLMPYYRAPGAISSVLKKATLLADPVDPTMKRWTPITGQRSYILDQDTLLTGGGLPIALLRFDNPGGPGLPAWPGTEPDTVGSVRMDRELQVTYLWQNNYARLAFDTSGAKRGQPVDAQGRVIGDIALIAPETDVVKVDYSTRDLMTVNVGALVYDTNTRQGTSINLSDKVRVGNTIR